MLPHSLKWTSHIYRIFCYGGETWYGLLKPNQIERKILKKGFVWDFYTAQTTSKIVLILDIVK